MVKRVLAVLDSWQQAKSWSFVIVTWTFFWLTVSGFILQGWNAIWYGPKEFLLVPLYWVVAPPVFWLDYRRDPSMWRR